MFRGEKEELMREGEVDRMEECELRKYRELHKEYYDVRGTEERRKEVLRFYLEAEHNYFDTDDFCH